MKTLLLCAGIALAGALFVSRAHPPAVAPEPGPGPAVSPIRPADIEADSEAVYRSPVSDFRMRALEGQVVELQRRLDAMTPGGAR